jgi:hypothetical protein
MGDRDSKSPAALGFLTVVAHEQHGLFGGFLVVDPGGRPLEFHCTAPVKTNRAQEILFGPTLQSYLYGEQIGHTLVSSARHKPQIICTDQVPALALRAHFDGPVVFVESASTGAGGTTHRVDPAHGREPRLVSFELGSRRLAVASDFASDQASAVAALEPIAARWDLAEPFVRIREAIDEAQRSGR